jgi:hypothetical protein
MGNTVKDGIIKLGGRQFKQVKNGLDKDQVASFIDELISERDQLSQSQAHMNSLTRLAEKTIAEADGLAEQIKTEAEERAKAESAAIINRAKEQAQQIVAEKESEAEKIMAEKESEAEKKAELLLENERARIKDKLSNFVNQQLGHLREELGRLEQQVTTAQADLDNKLSQSGEESSAVTVESEDEGKAVTAESEDENKAVTLESEDENKAVTAESEDEGKAVTAESEDEGKAVTAESEDENKAATMEGVEVSDESLEPGRDQEKTDRPFEIFEMLKGENRVDLGEPQWEVEILPPIDISKMMEIVARLDQLTEVENTEIIPRTDKPSIVVFQREPINLVNLLGEMPEVAYVEEVKTDKDSSNGKTRKVRIGLSGKTA